MSNTQADRLAEPRDCFESIKRHLTGQVSALATSIIATCDAGLAALAKQQASPDAQPVAEAFAGFHGTTVKWLSPFPIPSGTTLYTIPPSAPQQASPEAQQEWKVGNTVTIRPTRMEVFATPPSAPQAALPAGYSALIEAAADVLSLRTDGDKLTAAASLALDERLCLIAIKMRSAADAIAHGKSQAAALSDEQIREVILQTVYEGDSTVLYRDQWSTDIGIPFARAILAEAGITQEKSNG